MEQNQALSIEEVSEFLQIGLRTIYELARTGKIPCRKIGKHWRFDREKVIEWMGQPGAVKIFGKSQNQRLLIVEDKPDVVKLFTIEIKGAFPTLEIESSDNGISALVKVGQFKPHILLLDIDLPRLNGIEVCRLLKQDPATKDIQIIGISGLADPDIDKKCLEAGATGFVLKGAKAYDEVLALLKTIIK